MLCLTCGFCVWGGGVAPTVYIAGPVDELPDQNGGGARRGGSEDPEARPVSGAGSLDSE